MPFRAGQGGRKPGARNKNTRDAEAVCRKLVEDKVYRSQFKKRLLAATLPSSLEAMLWHYAYGKPKERLEVTGDDGGPVLVRFIDA